MKKLVLCISFIIMVCISVKAQIKEFPLPKVPSMLTTPQSRADYLAAHYWDNYDFKNSALIDNTDVTEQGFSNFLSIMPYVTVKDEAFATLFSKAAVNRKMLEHFMKLSEKYLYEIDSPLYDEELYIVALNKLIKLSEVPTEKKERLKFQHEMVMKNRVGHKAANFTYTLKNGHRGTLHTLSADYILIYFNDPTCDACNIMKNKLAVSPVINHMIDNGKLKLLAVCVENKPAEWKTHRLPTNWIDSRDATMSITDKELYHLPELPVMYLLDRNHNIILKNANFKKLEETLSSIRR